LYADISSYLFSESTEVTFSPTIKYILKEEVSSKGNINNKINSIDCLNFYVNFGTTHTKTIEKTITRNYTINDSFSSNIYAMA
jgi:hypothetical protein